MRASRSSLVLVIALAAPCAAEDVPDLAQQWHRSSPGFLPFYTKAGASEVLLEIGQLDEEFLYGVALSQGAGSASPDLQRGDIEDLRLCHFERAGKTILLVHQPTEFREESGAEGIQALHDSFARSVLWSFEVLAEQEGRVLIDIAPFLISAQHGRPWLGKGWTHDAGRSTILLDRSGIYPRNTEFETLMTFVAEESATGLSSLLPDPRIMTLRIRHTFLHLPEPGFEPRTADPRVGFFGPFYRNLSASGGDPLERRLAARWRLVKKDPEAALSEPVDPIVLYLDPAIPARHREAVRRGALAWNRAFEAAGLKNAITLEDLPEGASFADARYSGIQWVHRIEIPRSQGKIRTDPRTGEILHAVVSLDSGHTRETPQILSRLAPAPADACRLALEAATGSSFDDELMASELTYIAAHEVGHILGVAHNFGASAYQGSVMDYLPAAIRVEKGRVVVADEPYPTAVGDYDVMAIRWAYTPNADRQSLEAIVREGLARGLVYPQAEDARWTPFDLGPDPVAWLETKLAQRRLLLAELGPKVLREGELVQRLYERLNQIYPSHLPAIAAAARLVGGVRTAPALKGDGQPPVTWVPLAEQRRALDAVLATLSPENLEVPESLEQTMVLGPAPHGRMAFVSETGLGLSPAGHAETLASRIIYSLLYDDDQLARLTFARREPSLTINDVLTALIDKTWAPARNQSPRRDAVQRAAQRAVVECLILMAQAPEAADAKAAALEHLVRLGARLAAASSGDEPARAHRLSLRRQIAAFLNPVARASAAR